MNKDINKTLQALVPILNMNYEMVETIEAVKDMYEHDGKSYCKEVAEITYKNGYQMYADIGGDSNLTAIYDVMAVIQGFKKPSTSVGYIQRGLYENPCKDCPLNRL